MAAVAGKTEMPASPPTEKSVWDLRRAELLTSLARPPQAVFNRSGRLTGLAAASRRLPDRLLAESLAEMLGPVTGTKVLLLHLVPSEAEATAKVWNPLHSLPNGGFAFADQLQHLDHFARLTLRVTNHPAERAFLAAFLGAWLGRPVAVAFFAGSVLALRFTGTTLNIQSAMGAIMAVGVAVANAILLVTFAERARVAKAGNPSATDAARTGATSRLRPILMTSFAMMAGMLPMALGLGDGGEQTAPRGRAGIGGRAAATLATRGRTTGVDVSWNSTTWPPLSLKRASRSGRSVATTKSAARHTVHACAK